MRPSTRRILRIMADADRPLTVKEIHSGASDMKYRTVRYSIHMLISRGMAISRRDFRKDARSHLISLTKTAKEVLNE